MAEQLHYLSVSNIDQPVATANPLPMIIVSNDTRSQSRSPLNVFDLVTPKYDFAFLRKCIVNSKNNN